MNYTNEEELESPEAIGTFPSTNISKPLNSLK